MTEKVSGGQSFHPSIQNLLIFAKFKPSLNLNLIRHQSENWCPGYLKHAFSSSEIHLAAAKSLQIIGHVTNCCKRPIAAQLITNNPLMKGTVPKRLDICYDFGSSIKINHSYLFLSTIS